MCLFLQPFLSEWGDDVKQPVDSGFDGEISLKGHLCVEGFALRLGIGIEFSGDLVNIDPDVLYLGTEAGEFLHDVVEGEVAREDSDGLVGEDGADEAAHIVLLILVQEATQL